MKAVVLTGASSGIGLETARLLVRQGWHVLGVGRDERRCAAARENLLADLPEGRVDFFIGDLMQQRQVRRVAEEIRTALAASGEELAVLIHNAGCARGWYMTTEEGYEQVFALNVLAGVLMTRELLPLHVQSHGRVIFTGSESHRGLPVCWDDVMLSRRYGPLRGYQQSKLCGLLFARELNRRYPSLHACAVDPGLVRTEIGFKDTGGLVSWVWKQRRRRAISPEIPAKTFAWLCNQPETPSALYYCDLKEKPFSRQVTDENARRLFALCERLCGITFPECEHDMKRNFRKEAVSCGQ